jgi:uncharacterized membrane protein (DUF485 family)
MPPLARRTADRYKGRTMPGFDAPSPKSDEPHCERTAARNARTGLILFACYLISYAGFIALSAFAPGVMSRPAFAGLNFAIVYGFSLIINAFALALIYGWLCRRNASEGDR